MYGVRRLDAAFSDRGSTRSSWDFIAALDRKGKVMTKKARCSVIIVTHNSERVIHKAMECLYVQSVPADQILLVDTGSLDRSYLSRYEQDDNTQIIFAGNGVGFCRGNNEGFKHIAPETDYVFLVNPDAFLTERFIEEALAFMECPKNASCAVVTGKVYGYDLNNDCPSGFYDTTGIFQQWYGRWYDRGQGECCEENTYETVQDVPAICGALMFCRKKALDTILLRDREFFDNRFFMYKEDIDLSVRLRAKGWRLVYNPKLTAYHCRGWNPDRRQMPRRLRLVSARNELWIHLRARFVFGTVYSSLKYASVALFNK